MRAQIYTLIGVSILFLLYGVIGGVVVTTAYADSRLLAFTLPFMAVGVFGLPLTTAMLKLSQRLERLEKLMPAAEPSKQT
jgi:hypothetical protein